MSDYAPKPEYHNDRCMCEDCKDQRRATGPMVRGNPGWIAGTTGYQFAPSLISKLRPGVYKIIEDYNRGWVFQPVNMKSDGVLRLPDLPIDFLIEQVQHFWNSADQYATLKLVHKRGILLYGEPGSGKSSIIALVVEDAVARGGIVVLIDNFIEATKILPDIRKQSGPAVPVLTVCEDLDSVLNREQAKAALSFYDGQTQLDRILHIATTNHPQDIADRFIRRPGRFDLVVGLHAPTRETRRAYLKHMVPNLSDSDIEMILEATDGMGLSYMREIVAAHLAIGEPLKAALGRLKSNFKSKLSTKLGFSIGYRDTGKKKKKSDDEDDE